jgi:hypothetical protein
MVNLNAVNEITAALHPIPEGYFIEGQEDGTVIVGCRFPEPEGLGFAITLLDIVEGRHVQRAVDSFTDLMKAVEGGGNG